MMILLVLVLVLELVLALTAIQAECYCYIVLCTNFLVYYFKRSPYDLVVEIFEELMIIEQEG